MADSINCTMLVRMYNEPMQTVISQENILLDNLSYSVLVLDDKLRISYANLASQSMLQHSMNQLLGVDFFEIVLDASIKLSRFATTLNGGEDFSDSEVSLALADGREMLIDLSVTSFESNKRRALLVEMKKVDKQKKIFQENMQWMQQQAAQDLIRGLAHEIKNPLGGIRGAAQLLQREINAPQTEEYTQVIIEQSDRLTNLVDRLLGPNTLPDFQIHNIHKVLEKIYTLVTLDERHCVTIERDYDPSIPDLLLDEGMIQQAVLNIVMNSIQALSESHQAGKVQLVTRIERKINIHGNQCPLAVNIKVTDNGPGIPEELKETLFYPMVSGKKQHSGLGLSIAQTLIGHHGGKIEFVSRPGYTEFNLYLPITKKELE